MKVSIITINYNNLGGLTKTMHSVIGQTYIDKEYIVIDGGSNDGSKDFIEHNQFHLYYWISERDKGLYNAMNKGINHSTGDYIVFMNSGDVFLNANVLADIFESKQYNADVLIGSTIYQYGRGGILRHPRSLDIMNKELPFCHQSCFVKGTLMRSQLYDESYHLIADYAFFYQCYREGRTFEVVNKIISIYDTNGVSADNKRLRQIFKERCDIHKVSPSFIRFFINQCKSTAKLIGRRSVPSRVIDILLSRKPNSEKVYPLSSFMQI